MSVRGIGIDIVRVSRMRPYKDREHPFLTKNFSVAELAYCFSYADPALHLAGTFAAKEAVVKALGGKYALQEIAIIRDKNGAPCAYARNKKLPVALSITHEKQLAIAAALS